MAVWEQAEAARLAEENHKAMAEARRKAEDAALAEAAALEAEGDTEGAEAILEAPVIATVVPIREAPKAAGVSFRTNWKARVVDPMALLRAVVAGKVPAAAVSVNEAWLNQYARATKGEVPVPGVEFVAERAVAASGGRAPW